MKPYSRRYSPRVVFASLLIAASFFSAYFLTAVANHQEIFWIAKSPLVPGSIISSADIAPSKAKLTESVQRYFQTRESITGYLVVAAVGAGEMLPKRALTMDATAMEFNEVPVSVAISDLPANLDPGSRVDIYQVGDPRLTSTVIEPKRIVKAVFVLGVSKRGDGLGADISLTLSVRKPEILSLLKATSVGRIVIVRADA